ncbi:hypothetical protein F5B21DRAFT_519814 [Xylaria acuta]|nr:hypothetical protein F5B21DRAFT_519814 [Xylaria acuta]
MNHYRAIWSDQYEIIQHTRQRIHDLTQEIQRKITQIYADEGAPQPGQNGEISASSLTKKKMKLLKRVAFALSTDTRLSETIGRLKTAVENITDLCQDEFDKRIGGTGSTTVTARETEKLVRLISFVTPFTDRAETIYREHLTGQISQETNAWALELGKISKITNIKEWDQWDPVEVRFTFRVYPPHLHGTRMSLCVSHQREVNDNPGGEIVPIDVNWQKVICGDGAPRADVRREQWSAVRQCRPFGSLFRDGFFEDEAALKSWEPHRAELILSLANWVLLLWGTDWTSNLCSFGLRSVCTTADQIQNGHLKVGLSTLSADGSHRGDCSHHQDKLRNFSILLAELITATTIRRVEQPADATPVRYQRWSRAQDDWVPVSQREIISMVHEKSNSSMDMRNAVKYCLEEGNVRTSLFEAGHLLEYIVKLYEPIEKWCKDELKESMDFGLEAWPRAALEGDPAQQLQALPVHAYAYLGGRGGSTGVSLLAFAAGALVAVLAVWARDTNWKTLSLLWIDRYISDD